MLNLPYDYNGNWTITASKSSATEALTIANNRAESRKTGINYGNGSAPNVYPVMYLTSDVKIASSSGTSTSPYLLSK